MKNKIYKFIFLAVALYTAFSSYAQLQPKQKILNYLNHYQYDSALALIAISDSLNFQKYALKAYTSLKQYDKALLIAQEIYKKDSSDINVLILMSECYARLNQYQNAINILNYVHQIDTSNQFILLNLADSYYRIQDYKRCNSIYKKILNADSSNYYIIRQMAQSYERLNIPDSAIIYYKNAIELNPADYQSIFRLANFYAKRYQFNEGIEITEKYIKTDSLNTKINQINAYLYYLNKDYMKAIERFEYSRKLNDSSQFVNKFLGLSYFKEKYFGYAQRFLEKAYMNDSLNSELLYAYAIACIKSYYPDRGVKCLQKFKDLITPDDEKMSLLYLDFAEGYNAIHQPDKGLEYLLIAQKLSNEDTIMYFKIARQYDNQFENKKKEALQYYEKFLTYIPDETDSIKIENSTIEMSYFYYTKERIKALKEEVFWENKQND